MTQDKSQKNTSTYTLIQTDTITIDPTDRTLPDDYDNGYIIIICTSQTKIKGKTEEDEYRG